MVREGVQIVTGKIDEVSGRTHISDISLIATEVVGATSSVYIRPDMTSLGAAKILVRGIAAQFAAATGNANSFIAIRYNDGSNNVQLKRATESDPKVEWSGEWIDEGRMYGENGILVGRLEIYCLNNGAAGNTIKVVFNIEKIA